jgi:hypothetical protein
MCLIEMRELVSITREVNGHSQAEAAAASAAEVTLTG